MPSFFSTTICLSKCISKAGRKRIPLHRKHGDKNWYKGTGSAKTGHLNSLGRFRADPELLPNIVVPDLSGFKVSVLGIRVSNVICVCYGC